MKPGRLVVAATLATVLAVPPARGGDTGAAARRELTRLKAICDAGLVAPAICLEKQRAILGLPSRQGVAETPPLTDEVPEIVAIVHESSLGFRLALPAGWTALSPDQVAAGFDVLRSRTEGSPDAARLVDRLRAEDMRDEAPFFIKGRDTLQVTRSARQPPGDAVTRATFCEHLEAATSKAAARPLRTYACGVRVVAGAPAFHMERDGLLPGTRTFQYWLAAPDGTSIQLVMSSQAADADERRREVDRREPPLEMIRSGVQAE